MDHRDLHSFPTRRSSDFGPADIDQHEASDLPEHPAGKPEQHREPQDVDPPRSEEHTSELQSRENLVCRLLLEKKKQLFPYTLPFDPSTSPYTYTNLPRVR